MSKDYREKGVTQIVQLAHAMPLIRRRVGKVQGIARRHGKCATFVRVQHFIRRNSERKECKVCRLEECRRGCVICAHAKQLIRRNPETRMCGRLLKSSGLRRMGSLCTRKSTSTTTHCKERKWQEAAGTKQAMQILQSTYTRSNSCDRIHQYER